MTESELTVKNGKWMWELMLRWQLSMPGTAPSAARECHNNPVPWVLGMSPSAMREQRHRKVRQLTHSYIASRWQNQDLNPGSLAQESMVSATPLQNGV